MGNKPTKIEVKDASLKTVMGSCGLGSCASSCCIADPDSNEHKLAEQAKEIQMALRYGSNMSADSLLKAIRKIVEETGVVPSIVVIPPGGDTPEITKRTLTLHIGDHSPTECSPKGM